MKRWWALDRLRALAVVSMIQGHTFTALLREGELTGGLRRVHSLIHGLTGPAFLFGAGLAFGVTTYAQYERHRRPGPEFRARMRRYLMLLVIGYALQLPGASLWRAFSLEERGRVVLLRVGPLQSIAITLLVCQLLVLVARTPRVHALLVTGLGVVVMTTTEAVYRSGIATRLGPGWGSFLDDSFSSQYPIFPAASFAMLGVGASLVLRHVQPRGRTLAVAGAVFSGALFAAYQAGWFTVDAQFFWRTNPSVGLFRLGLVVFVLGILHRPDDSSPLARPRARFDQRVPQPGTIASLAKHSLIAYVVHLLLLYGTPLTPNFAYRHGHSLSMSQTCLAFVLVMGGTLLIVRVWEWLKREQAPTYRWVQAGLTVLGLVMLVR